MVPVQRKQVSVPTHNDVDEVEEEEENDSTVMKMQ